MAKRRKKSPSHEAQDVPARRGRNKAWYYEFRGGIDVLVEGPTATLDARIPWSLLMKSAKRCGWTVYRRPRSSSPGAETTP